MTRLNKPAVPMSNATEMEMTMVDLIFPFEAAEIKLFVPSVRLL